MKKVGVIDIGPSSIRLLLTQIDSTGYFKVIDELKSPLRLCDDLVNDCEICSTNISSIISTLNSYKSLCIVSGASKVIAIATESFRTAKNKDKLISLIKETLNIDINVLDSENEIYYNFLGVTRSVNFNNSLIVEVAASDTHITWVKNGKIQNNATIPYGSVNLSYKFNLNDLINRDDISNAVKLTHTLLKEHTWLNENKFDSIIAVGETARNLGKIDRFKKRYPFDIPHNYKLEDIDIHDIFVKVKSKDLKQRRKIEGIDCEFADLIVGGLTIFNSIIEVLNIQNITISSRGLREGIIYEYINENFTIPSNILDYSIDGIINTLNINKDHAINVFNITLKLFNELKPLHKLNSDFENIIKTATLLHDCGISINYYNHHRHSFYVILHSHINGLSHKELLISAAIAASHRFNSYQLPLPQYTSILSQIDLKSINRIGTLLKLAEGLDRSLVGAVKDLDIEFDDETVKIMVYSDINVDLEIRQALRASNKFKEIYNRNLIIIQR